MLEALKDISPEVLRQLVDEIQSPEVVDYRSKDGGVCPVCSTRKCRVTVSGPWVGSARERFHKCRGCGLRFKSVEIE